MPPPVLLESTPKGDIGLGVTTVVEEEELLGVARAMGLCPRRLSDDAFDVL